MPLHRRLSLDPKSPVTSDTHARARGANPQGSPLAAGPPSTTRGAARTSSGPTC